MTMNIDSGEVKILESGSWVRVINPARGTYLDTGFVTTITESLGITLVRVQLIGLGEYIYNPDELEEFIK